MNIAELHRKLIAAARAERPSERVPYAFEKRIMARLRESPALDVWAFWGRALWRAAAPCVAIMLALAVWSFYAADINAAGEPYLADLDQAVLAPVVSGLGVPE
jgi:hypothetical protein